MSDVSKNTLINLADLNKTPLKFQEVFWRPEFSDNKNISSYMLLDKLILNSIGTYLVTYGYSGVGKSFTLFGGNGEDGLLQATIANISTAPNFSGLKLRTYELYGLGMGYSDCWKDYAEIDQTILHYNLQDQFGQGDDAKVMLDNDIKVLPRKGDDIPKYIKFLFFPVKMLIN